MSSSQPPNSLLTRRSQPPHRVSNLAFGLSFIPVIGGLCLVKASTRLSDRTGTHLSWAIFALGLVSALASHFLTTWLLQIGLAIWLKAKHAKPPISILPAQVDLNNCAKHDLVHILDLPIVYANDIDLIRREGYLFTHPEELIEIVGIPEAHVRRITPQLIFAYDSQKDSNHSWRALNCLTANEMINRGVASDTAQTIVKERTQNGDYRSAVDVKRRTGLPFHTYQPLVYPQINHRR